MQKNISHTLENIMKERFGKDSLIALATVSDGKPYVRAVNSYYEDGCFYVITYELSNKMRHIRENPIIGICGEWFTAQGVGESLGYICANENRELAEKLRRVFSEWYYNGHTDEGDENPCILRIKLESGVLLKNGVRYDVDFREIADE